MAAADGPRAFELVTPPDSLARIEVFGSFGLDDGNTVFFSSYDSLPGAVPNGPLPTLDSWRAKRGPNGWSSQWVTDAPLSEPGTTGSRTMFTNADGSVSIMHTETGIDPADDFAHSVDPYLRQADGTISWLAPGPRTGIEFRKVMAASDDLGQLLLTADQPIVPGDDLDESQDLYIWDHGTLRLITPGTASNVTLTMMGANAEAFPGTMSEDGSRVFFGTSDALVVEDTDAAEDIYVREGDAYRLVSVDRRAEPGVPLAPTFFGAAGDGSVACFATETPLEDGDTDTANDLYCYDLEADSLERVSAGSEDNTETPVVPLGLSGDGGSVFFRTTAALTGDDLDGVASMFRRSGGVTEYLGPIEESDIWQERRVASEAAVNRALRISADGSHLIFTSAAQLLPSDTDDQPDVYRWVAGQGFTHVSLSAEGGNGTAESASGAFDPLGIDSFSGKPVDGRIVTADRQAIFFDSADSLVAADTDGGFVDVYEWRQGGVVRLVSPGGSYPGDSRYVDNSVDGSTVFFVTPEPIAAQDVNGGVRDLYAARVGGGFPQPPPDSTCSGDGCQGQSNPPPPLPLPTTAGFVGRGNVTSPPAKKSKRCRKNQRKVRRGGKVRCVKVRSSKGKRSAKASRANHDRRADR